MPTPSGMLKAGDRIRFKSTGQVFVVVKREGNDAIYSVILRPEKPLPPEQRQPLHAYGYPADHFRLLEAAYYVGRTYELVTDSNSNR